MEFSRYRAQRTWPAVSGRAIKLSSRIPAMTARRRTWLTGFQVQSSLPKTRRTTRVTTPLRAVRQRESNPKMLQQVTDFHAEGAELRELLLTLADSDWERKTLFKDWTVN